MNDQLEGSDISVAGQLRELPNTTTTEEHFAEAIRLGATSVLLSRIALYQGYFTKDADQRAVSLPYIPVLQNAGWSSESIRDFVSTVCFADCEYGQEIPHRLALLQDDNAWKIFETAKQLIMFMVKMAKHEAGHILTAAFHSKLATMLGTLRNNNRQNHLDIMAIKAEAARNIEIVESHEQLDILINVLAEIGTNQSSKVAARLTPLGLNLVVIGYVLATCNRARREEYRIVASIHQQLAERPELGAQMYRWMLEGCQRTANDPWRFGARGAGFRWLFSSFGWEILTVMARPEDTRQVILTDRSKRIILRHEPGEQLNVGDEVIVSRHQLRNLKPSHEPGSTVFTLTLHPAIPPTAEMLANPRQCFPLRRRSI